MNRMIKSGHILLALFILCIAGSNSNAEDLPSLVKKGLEAGPFLEKFNAENKKANLLQKEIDVKKYLPEFNLNVRGGIVPEARGDIFYSPDEQSDLDGWGGFVQTEFMFVQPVYTFGKISNAEAAAGKKIKSDIYKNTGIKEEYKKLLSEVYFGNGAAQKALEMSEELKENYNTLISKIKEELNNELSEIDATDLLEAESNEFVVSEVYLSASSKSKDAEAAIEELLGFEPDIDELEFPDLEVDFDEFQLEDVIRYSLTYHYKLKAVEAGKKALQSKYDMEKSGKFPNLFIAGGASYGYAPNRADQKNPFVYDNFNFLNAGAFMGLSWNLNFWDPDLKMEKTSAELEILESDEKLLKSRIRMNVTRAYNKAKKEQGLVEKLNSSLASARQWLRLSLDNFSMGIGDPERLIKSYNTYYQIKGKIIQKELEFKTSLISIAYEIGNMDKFMEWFENEKVSI